MKETNFGIGFASTGQGCRKQEPEPGARCLRSRFESWVSYRLGAITDSGRNRFLTCGMGTLLIPSFLTCWLWEESELLENVIHNFDSSQGLPLLLPCLRVCMHVCSRERQRARESHGLCNKSLQPSGLIQHAFILPQPRRLEVRSQSVSAGQARSRGSRESPRPRPAQLPELPP